MPLFILIFSLFLTPLMGKEVTLTILSLNDIYEILPHNGYGGLAEMMTLLKEEREKSEHYLTTVNGDFLSPSLISGIFRGSQMVDLFNRMEVDLVVFGNHEFDYGIETLMQRMRESDFCWLGTNVLTWPKEIPFNEAQSSVIVDIEGILVGIIGICTTETSQLVRDLSEVTFTPIVLSSQAAVHRLKKEGADVIIALTHLSIEEDIYLAKQVPEIDVILGGHDHESITWFNDKTLIHKSGHDAQFLARIDLKMEKRKIENNKMKTFVFPSWRMIPNHGVARDSDLGEQIDYYANRIEQELSQEIGLCGTMLDSTNVRSGESSMGNLVADALRDHLGSHVALINGGAIRGQQIYLPGIKLTKRDIQEELPFSNICVLVEVTGEELLATLESGLGKIEAKSGGFLQLSGIKLVYDPNGLPNTRIREIAVNGEAIDKKQRYRLATTDYLLKGGDGNMGLRNAKVLMGPGVGPLLTSVVIEYLMTKSLTPLNLDGRILDCSIQMDVKKVNVLGKRVQLN
jgi:5'-nucleotidase/UDP-sugar diphosphatase